jgi:hypothetical protein
MQIYDCVCSPKNVSYKSLPCLKGACLIPFFYYDDILTAVPWEDKTVKVVQATPFPPPFCSKRNISMALHCINRLEIFSSPAGGVGNKKKQGRQKKKI